MRIRENESGNGWPYYNTPLRLMGRTMQKRQDVLRKHHLTARRTSASPQVTGMDMSRTVFYHDARKDKVLNRNDMEYRLRKQSIFTSVTGTI